MSAGRILRSREIPWLLLVIAAVITVVAWFLTFKEVQDPAGALKVWVVIMGGFAVAGLGPIAIVIFHTSRIRRRTAGQWPFSIWMLIIMFVTIGVGLFLPPIAASPQFTALFNALYFPIQSTLYAMLAFWIVSAAFRAFRVRNKMALVLFIAAVLVLFSVASFGGALWSGFGPIGQWVNDVLGASAFRGIVIGSAIGVIALALRVLLGYERTALGGGGGGGGP